MIVQISSGQGPAECELAVVKLYNSLKAEHKDIEARCQNIRLLHFHHVFDR